PPRSPRPSPRGGAPGSRAAAHAGSGAGAPRAGPGAVSGGTRSVRPARRRPRLSARQDGHGVAARAERLDQDARLLLDASDLAVARAEEGDPHRSPLSAHAAPVPGAVQSSAWRL